MDTTIQPINPLPTLSDAPAFKRRVRKRDRLPKDTPDQVGEGVVSSDAEAPARRRKRSVVVEETASKVVALDPQAEWIDEPTMVDQIKDDNAWKPTHQEARVFNLSDTAQLGAYNDLLALCGSPTTNCFIIKEEQQFAPTMGTWSCLVRLQFVKYRKILKKTKS